MALTFLLALIPALIWLPTIFESAADVVSASQAEGYNNRAAHLLVVGWVLACAMTLYFLLRASTFPPVKPASSGSAGRRSSIDSLQLLLVAMAVLALYFPPALARYGSYLEEAIHLGALHRMLAGDIPYRDFEFLYGPLMLYTAYFWTRATEYSLVSFYAYVALVEIIVFVAIFWLVQKYLSRFWARFGAFLLLAPLFFNPLVGPNQNGIRKLAGILILFSVASNPWSRWHWLIHGLGIGALLSYSQEFGAATALGTAAIYATLLAKNRAPLALGALGVIAIASALTWGGITWALLGSDTKYYVETLAYLTARFNLGEAAFPFSWTLNGLAVFGLIFLALWHVATAMARPWQRAAGPGDLIFVAGIVYALVMLKSGLSRADQWHLVPGVLVLAFAFVLPVPALNAQLNLAARRIGIALVLVLAVTYSFGQFPHARYVFREGLIRGYGDLFTGVPANLTPNVAPVRPALIYERSFVDPEVAELGDFLSSPPQRGRRVFIYGRPWALPYAIGVTKAGILGDDYIYGDERGEQIRAQLEESPETLVVIQKGDYEWLLEGPDAPVPDPQLYLLGSGKWRTTRGLVSSAHIGSVELEERLKKDRWRRLVGNYVVANYKPVYRGERYYVLERNSD